MFRSFLAIVLLTSVCAFAEPVSPPTKPVSGDISSQIKFAVEKYQLANGLTVLLTEDHSAPIISLHVWFRVGSKDEEPGYTGLAHLFEHMMFKGAKRYTGEQFDTLLQANGASNNAFTTYDFTGYYEDLPAAKLELVLDLESDRMQSLQVTAENLKSEREVVKEERRMRVDNSPAGVLQETLYGTAYRVHPYRWPVIGYMADINNITLEKAQDFHRQYYAPNNAVVVVSGDFQSGEAKRLIEKYFGGIPSQEIKRRERPAEPAVNASRFQMVTRDVQASMFAMAFHAPKAGDEDSFALDLLANILARGTSSRVFKPQVFKYKRATSLYAVNN
jgi:zinc protease